MKINELTKPGIQLFQDLDGCLADFEKAVQELLGKHTSEIPQGLLWATVGDQTIKSDSHAHKILHFIWTGQELPKEYQAMSKVLRMLKGAGLILTDSPFNNDTSNLGEEAAGQMNHGGPDFVIKKNFYNKLDWMPDGKQLWDFMESNGAVVLTGLPHGDWAAPQKYEWCRRELGLDKDKVLVGMARDKAKTAAEYLGRPLNGDILVDDREKHAAAWEAAGGVWITHTSAANSIAKVKELL